MTLRQAQGDKEVVNLGMVGLANGSQAKGNKWVSDFWHDVPACLRQTGRTIIR